MTTSQTDVEQTIRAFLVRAKKPVDDLSPETPLFADGIGLDSLETAELSAIIEDEHGVDPFSGGEMPRTVGDILQFYGAAVADA